MSCKAKLLLAVSITVVAIGSLIAECAPFRGDFVQVGSAAATRPSYVDAGAGPGPSLFDPRFVTISRFGAEDLTFAPSN
jgi:hypothetical protein